MGELVRNCKAKLGLDVSPKETTPPANEISDIINRQVSSNSDKSSSSSNESSEPVKINKEDIISALSSSKLITKNLYPTQPEIEVAGNSQIVNKEGSPRGKAKPRALVVMNDSKSLKHVSLPAPKFESVEIKKSENEIEANPAKILTEILQETSTKLASNKTSPTSQPVIRKYKSSTSLNASKFVKLLPKPIEANNETKIEIVNNTSSTANTVSSDDFVLLKSVDIDAKLQQQLALQPNQQAPLVNLNEIKSLELRNKKLIDEMKFAYEQLIKEIKNNTGIFGLVLCFFFTIIKSQYKVLLFSLY